MTDAPREGVYGLPPDTLVSHGADATQLSPLIPGSAAVEEIEAGSLESLAMLAPPGTLERRYALAACLRALAPGAPFTIMAPKDRGGSRLATELARFGCAGDEAAKKHHRIVAGHRPTTLSEIEPTLREGGPQTIEPLGLWSQPGVFSWDRLDPGSALLVRVLPQLSGSGADFGCGIGSLAVGALRNAKVKRLLCIDVDRRAIDAARRNVVDERVSFRWADLRQPDPALTRLDFVVMNPPFHDGGTEDRALGQIFVRRAAESLRTGGRLWLTANRHLPYEAVMKPLFRTVTPVIEEGGYKVYEAIR